MARRLWGFSFHHYAWNVSGGRTTDWNEGKGPAVGFTMEQHYELLRDADKMDGFITAPLAGDGRQFDRARTREAGGGRVGRLAQARHEAHPSHTLGQISTLRDALLAGLTLDTFQRHADKVGMANIAQLVNCLQSLFVAHEDKFIVTPNYHVFEMYMDHMGAEAVRTEFVAPRVIVHSATGSRRRSGASRDRRRAQRQDGDAHGGEPERRPAARRRKSPCAARRSRAPPRTLTAAELDAHNSFEAPERRAGAEGEPGDPGAPVTCSDVAQGVGEQDPGHPGLTGLTGLRGSAGRSGHAGPVEADMGPHIAMKRFLTVFLLLASVAATHIAWSADAGRRVWIGTYTEGTKSKGIYTGSSMTRPARSRR